MAKRRRPDETQDAAVERGWDRYSAAFRTEVLPALIDSAYMLSVADEVDPDTLDLRAATELGLMLLLDKPLVVVVPTGTAISPALRRAAAVVIEDFDVADPRQQERVVAALKSLARPPDAEAAS